jgi:hypothetical protein
MKSVRHRNPLMHHHHCYYPDVLRTPAGCSSHQNLSYNPALSPSYAAEPEHVAV